MKPATTWLIVGAVAIIAAFLYLRGRSVPSIQQIGGDTSSADRNALLSGISALAPVAEAEYAAENQLQLAQIQANVQGAAINAGVETARINAGAYEAAARRTAAAQENNSIFSFLGDIVPAILATL